MRPVGRWLARTPLSPDAVTLLGVLIQAGVAVLIIQGHLLVAGLVAIIAALADALDGALAKAKGQTSRFGALLDSTTDRLADALFFIPIAWLYGVSPDIPGRESHLIAALALTGLVASFLVSYVKGRAEALGFDCNVGIAERAERLIVLILALIFDLVLAGVTILAVLATVTVLQRLVYVRRQSRETPRSPDAVGS
ncbi:MAG: CDP-diacylglycerol---glycerol-3-phosphate 3-phosphatidyltransferase [Actinomycetota bacterium]|nr:CDP-diacylglycerol---glycerol-3-phosphate 3-phosphatidyltransferase [Actinomycetota bacterium]